MSGFIIFKNFTIVLIINLVGVSLGGYVGVKVFLKEKSGELEGIKKAIAYTAFVIADVFMFFFFIFSSQGALLDAYEYVGYGNKPDTYIGTVINTGDDEISIAIATGEIISGKNIEIALNTDDTVEMLQYRKGAWVIKSVNGVALEPDYRNMIMIVSTVAVILTWIIAVLIAKRNNFIYKLMSMIGIFFIILSVVILFASWFEKPDSMDKSFVFFAVSSVVDTCFILSIYLGCLTYKIETGRDPDLRISMEKGWKSR